ncbi:MAG: hypothetical protein ABI566_12725 [Pseudolysinimonas sp.]
MSPETVAALDRLGPLCEEFGRALLSDVGYSIEIAREGARYAAKAAEREARAAAA